MFGKKKKEIKRLKEEVDYYKRGREELYIQNNKENIIRMSKSILEKYKVVNKLAENKELSVKIKVSPDDNINCVFLSQMMSPDSRVSCMIFSDDKAFFVNSDWSPSNVPHFYGSAFINVSYYFQKSNFNHIKAWGMTYSEKEGLVLDIIRYDDRMGVMLRDFHAYLHGINELLDKEIKKKERKMNDYNIRVSDDFAETIRVARQEIAKQDKLIRVAEKAMVEKKENEFYVSESRGVKEAKTEEEIYWEADYTLDNIKDLAKEAILRAKYVFRLKGETKLEFDGFRNKIEDKVVAGDVVFQRYHNKTNTLQDIIVAETADGITITQADDEFYVSYYKVSFENEKGFVWEITFLKDFFENASTQLYNLNRKDLKALENIKELMNKELRTIEKFITIWEYS